MPDIAAALKDVTLIFNDVNGVPVLAVDDVSIEVPVGQFLAIVGPSGCGKTTVLNMLSGLINPTLGSVEKHGIVVSGPSMDVGYMLARSALFPWRTARRNVEMPMEIREVSKVDRKRRAEELLEMVKLSEFKNKFPSQLSQGMRQRVAIARTLAINPKLWLLDEPFSALDAQTRITVQNEFLRLWENTGSTVILVTHDLAEAVLLADRVIVMTARPGKIKLDQMIDIPRPRHVDDLQVDEHFMHLEATIWKELRDELI
ncbi:MAG: ABC transporter ATP-binding protein [Ilumatobacteraceae bacterium]|jgi:NitT/TauT family transport system ATP-binding protein|nr:ABC transporter ATP-binding protein [Ilumatobacteraceae bacterium]